MINKKQIILTSVAVLTFILLISTATYAYFKISVDSNATQTNISINSETVGVVSLTKKANVDNLSLNITATQMLNNYTTQDVAYYASTTGATTTETNVEVGRIEVVGNGTFYCTYTFNIVDSSPSGTKSLYDAFKSSNYSNKTTNELVLTFDGTTMDFYNSSITLPKTITKTVTVNSSTPHIIYTKLMFKNRAGVDQGYLNGSNMSLSFNKTAFNCEIDYADSTLNGADPVLGQDMIPVTIDNNGVVKYADITKAWYNYSTSQITDISDTNITVPAKTWANAVMLVNGSDDYNVGEIIDEADIANYLVWIPRYEYQLFNVNFESIDSQTINIHFGSKTNMVEKNGTNNGDWLTHPAFTTFNSNGFWIGKFELTNASSNTDIKTKPNLDAADGVSVSNFFTRMYNYSRVNDSHMINNSEWGAVAYLSHSIYGINGPVWKNDFGGSSSGALTKTGCTGIDEEGVSSATTCVTSYGSGATFYGGSTTGNISGVFDMSGGVWEYTTGYLQGSVPSYDGFTSTDISQHDSKYFDVYEGSRATYSHLGDATGETRTWYGDYSSFVTTGFPWFLRGGHVGSGSPNSGQFACGSFNGSASWTYGSRLVLCPVA